LTFDRKRGNEGIDGNSYYENSEYVNMPYYVNTGLSVNSVQIKSKYLRCPA